MKRFINGCDAQIVPLRSNLFVPAQEKKIKGGTTIWKETRPCSGGRSALMNNSGCFSASGECECQKIKRVDAPLSLGKNVQSRGGKQPFLFFYKEEMSAVGLVGGEHN